MKFLISIILVSSTISFAQPLSCKTAVSSVAKSGELANAVKLSELVMKEISKTSRKMISQIRKNPTVFDVICLGAGPQCAAASMVLAQGNLKAAVVDKAQTVASNFADKDFQVNSWEDQDISMHRFPGSRVEFAHFTSSKYANSRQLAAYIQSVQYQSKVPVILGTEVISFELVQENGNPLVLLKTANGLEIKTRKVLVGTGLGEANTKIPTPFYQQLYKESVSNSYVSPEQLQIVMSTETFMKALHIDPRSGKKVKLPTSVAVIGSGDGARIAIEEMIESFVVLPKGFKIYWVGQELATAEAYVTSQKKNDRYIEKIVEHYNRGHIVSVPGYAIDAQMLENGQLQIKAQVPDTKATQLATVDMVIDSTGYENRLQNQMNQFFGKTSLKDVKGDLPERNELNTNIARQVVLENGSEAPIYFIGAAAGPLWTREQMTPLKNRNPVSIYNNIPLTQELVKKLFNLPGFSRDMGAQGVYEEVLPAEEIFKRL